MHRLSRRVASVERRARPNPPRSMLVVVVGDVANAERERAVAEARRRGEGIVVVNCQK